MIAIGLGAVHAKFYHKIELNLKSGLTSDVSTFFHSALHFNFYIFTKNVNRVA